MSTYAYLCIFKGLLSQTQALGTSLSSNSHTYPLPATARDEAIPMSFLTMQLYFLPVPWQAAGLEAGGHCILLHQILKPNSVLVALKAEGQDLLLELQKNQ